MVVIFIGSRWRWSLYVYAEEEKVVIYAHGEGLYMYRGRWSLYVWAGHSYPRFVYALGRRYKYIYGGGAGLYTLRERWFVYV